jgi:hypothetical protein
LAWVKLLPAGTLRVSHTLPPMVEPLTDGDPSKNRRPGVNHHIILNNRMAWMALLQLPVLVRREALGTQCHGLINPHPLADDRRLADHHTRPVINEETTTDLRARDEYRYR